MIVPTGPESKGGYADVPNASQTNLMLAMALMAQQGKFGENAQQDFWSGGTAPPSSRKSTPKAP